jgi:hypothetical protein
MILRAPPLRIACLHHFVIASSPVRGITSDLAGAVRFSLVEWLVGTPRGLRSGYVG